MSEPMEPILIRSIRETMRRLTLKDWPIELERLDFQSLQELHLFVLTVEARVQIERDR